MSAESEVMVEISERLEALREWEVHWRRWVFHELAGATDPRALLNWLPDEILDHVLPTNRTVRAHLELQQSEAERIAAEMEERMARHPTLTVLQLRRKVDPLVPGDEGVGG